MAIQYFTAISANNHCKRFCIWITAKFAAINFCWLQCLTACHGSLQFKVHCSDSTAIPLQFPCNCLQCTHGFNPWRIGLKTCKIALNAMKELLHFIVLHIMVTYTANNRREIAVELQWNHCNALWIAGIPLQFHCNYWQCNHIFLINGS